MNNTFEAAQATQNSDQLLHTESSIQGTSILQVCPCINKNHSLLPYDEISEDNQALIENRILTSAPLLEPEHIFMRGSGLDALAETNSTYPELSKNVSLAENSTEYDSLLGGVADETPIVGDLTEVTSVKFYAAAQGSISPPIKTIKSDLEQVSNGDFKVTTSREDSPILGDGLNEVTKWMFDFTHDTNYSALKQVSTLTSAVLTLDIAPQAGSSNDVLGIEGLEYGLSTGGGDLPLQEKSTVVVDLLDAYSSGQIINELKTGNLGKMGMYYADDAIVASASLEMVGEIPPIFKSGVFTVGETGQIVTDFLFDGGGFEGDLTVFNLEGMENLNPDSQEFTKEAARRGLSNSNLGHIVISDPVEGALITGMIPHDGEFNRGKYSGQKTFSMEPEDRFGFMLVPNGWAQEAFSRPNSEGLRNLFSLWLSLILIKRFNLQN